MSLPFPPATRLQGLGVSPIRAIQQGAPPGAIPLGLGEPSWDLPEAGRKALAGSPGPCAYGPNAGLDSLRNELADFYQAEPDEVLVASGSEGALFSLFQAWLGPGDAVLVPDPGFLAYPRLAALSGAQARPYALGRDFALDPGLFEAALLRGQAEGAAIKAAVLNHPGNPTGAGATREAMAAVATLCETKGILLISDEVYRELYLGQRPPSLRDVSAYGLVLSSVSKAWGGPGLRVGWAIGDKDILAPARLVHNYAVTAAARPSQEACLALLKDSGRVLPAARRELARRWEAFSQAMTRHLGLGEPRLPAGAFYYWLALPPGEADSTAFCLRVRDEAGVVMAPGSAFGPGGEGHVRLSYAASVTEIGLGLERLAPYWSKA